MIRALLAILAIVIALAYYNVYKDTFPRETPKEHGGLRLSEVCLEGVTYYHNKAVLTPKYKRDGEHELCADTTQSIDRY